MRHVQDRSVSLVFLFLSALMFSALIYFQMISLSSPASFHTWWISVPYWRPCQKKECQLTRSQCIVSRVRGCITYLWRFQAETQPGCAPFLAVAHGWVWEGRTWRRCRPRGGPLPAPTTGRCASATVWWWLPTQTWCRLAARWQRWWSPPSFAGPVCHIQGCPKVQMSREGQPDEMWICFPSSKKRNTYSSPK